jgi:hypothetical protein
MNKNTVIAQAAHSQGVTQAGKSDAARQIYSDRVAHA